VCGQPHASASLPPRERVPSTHWIGDWVGPRAVLDAVVKRKIPSPHQESNPDRPTRSSALYRLSYVEKSGNFKNLKILRCLPVFDGTDTRAYKSDSYPRAPN
jgi:hypothetical protein